MALKYPFVDYMGNWKDSAWVEEIVTTQMPDETQGAFYGRIIALVTPLDYVAPLRNHNAGRCDTISTGYY